MKSELQIRQFIINWINSIKSSGDPLSSKIDCNLIAEKYVDSIEFLDLIVAIEEEFSIEIDFEDINPDEFTTMFGLAKAVIASLESRKR